MSADVLCLRPVEDFLAVGITPPVDLRIDYRGPTDPDLEDLMVTAKALVIPAVGPALDPALFRDSALRLVQITGAGLDRVDQGVLREQGIALANVPGGSNAAVAEYVVSNVLALRRGFFGASARLRAGHYSNHRAAMVKASLSGLGGLTVGLVGMGTIGLAVAERCGQMGAEILYHDPGPPRDPNKIAALGARFCDLGELFETADVVSLHVPLLDTTRNLVGARLLARMKPDAILVHAARGGIVDEVALATAIENKALSGAAVDVFSTEPPTPDNPLLSVSEEAAARLILTPHIAGVSRQSSRFLFKHAWDNVARVLIHGQPPENAVSDTRQAAAPYPVGVHAHR